MLNDWMETVGLYTSRLFHCCCTGEHALSVGCDKASKAVVDGSREYYDLLWAESAWVSITSWQSGNRNIGFWERLKYAIGIIFDKDVLVDEVLLNYHDALEFSKYINEAAEIVAEGNHISIMYNEELNEKERSTKS